MRLVGAIVIVLVALGCQLVPGPFDTPAWSKDAVAYQINVAHTGVGSIPGFKGKLKPLWTQNLGTTISYPLITHSLTYVTIADTSYNNTWLYALDTQTGATVWKQFIQEASTGRRRRSTEAGYSSSTRNGVLRRRLMRLRGTRTGRCSCPANTTSPRLPLLKRDWCSSMALATGQRFMLSSRSTGKLQWSAPRLGGSGASSPALGKGKRFRHARLPILQLRGRNRQALLNWHDSCTGSGGTTPVYFDQRLYVRAPSNVVLDAKTGATLGIFAAVLPPTFFKLKHGSYGVAYVSSSLLNCFDTTTGTTRWTFSGDSSLTSAPLVVGHYIIEGAGSGNLYVLDAKTGDVTWSANVGAGILYP